MGARRDCESCLPGVPCVAHAPQEIPRRLDEDDVRPAARIDTRRREIESLAPTRRPRKGGAE